MAGDEQESGKPSSFKVQDRRRFSATGEARENVEEPTEPGGAPSDPAATAAPCEIVASDLRDLCIGVVTLLDNHGCHLSKCLRLRLDGATDTCVQAIY